MPEAKQNAAFFPIIGTFVFLELCYSTVENLQVKCNANVDPSVVPDHSRRAFRNRPVTIIT